MSDRQNENASRIAAYLENRLSPEEKEAFKRQLSEDDELRLQYVDALMNRAGTGHGGAVMGGAVVSEPEGEKVSEPVSAKVSEPVAEKEPEVEEAPEPEVMEGGYKTLGEQGAREAWEAGWPGGKKKARSGFLGSGWILGITVLLLIVAGVVMYSMSRHQDLWDKVVAAFRADSTDANKIKKTDSVETGAVNKPVRASANGGDSARKGGGVDGGAGTWGDSLYKELYKPYMRGDDPIEVRGYYQDYRTGNYAAVLAADSAVTGVGARKLQIKNYLRLYKGLAYLATGDGREAVEQLGAVVLRTNPGDQLYEVARWYLALAWVKRNDIDPAEAKAKASGLARQISHGYSRYREPARELVRRLGS